MKNSLAKSNEKVFKLFDRVLSYLLLLKAFEQNDLTHFYMKRIALCLC